MKRVGIDLGSVRIGVSASDETGAIAFARRVLRREGTRKDLEKLRAIVVEEGASEVVVGHPLRSDGSEGDRALAARRFAEGLALALGVPVKLWDERHSTLEAEAGLRELGRSAKQARGKVDAEAARVILQRYLDHVNRAGAPS